MLSTNRPKNARLFRVYMPINQKPHTWRTIIGAYHVTENFCADSEIFVLWSITARPTTIFHPYATSSTSSRSIYVLYFPYLLKYSRIPSFRHGYCTKSTSRKRVPSHFQIFESRFKIFYFESGSQVFILKKWSLVRKGFQPKKNLLFA